MLLTGMDDAVKNMAKPTGGTLSPFMKSAGPIMSILGGIASGFGSYYSAKSAKDNMQFSADMSAINARAAEKTAQSILSAGSVQQSQIGLRAGKVKGSQLADQGARGVAIGVGSAAEEVATTDLMKETDMMTINANAVRQAAAARTQATNAQNMSNVESASASSVSPWAAVGPSLLGSATAVASSWYSNKRQGRFDRVLGVS